MKRTQGDKHVFRAFMEVSGIAKSSGEGAVRGCDARLGTALAPAVLRMLPLCRSHCPHPGTCGRAADPALAAHHTILVDLSDFQSESCLDAYPSKCALKCADPATTIKQPPNPPHWWLEGCEKAAVMCQTAHRLNTSAYNLHVNPFCPKQPLWWRAPGTALMITAHKKSGFTEAGCMRSQVHNPRRQTKGQNQNGSKGC